MDDDIRINEVEVQKLERVGTHSHIIGLGLDDNLNPLPVSIVVVSDFSI